MFYVKIDNLIYYVYINYILITLFIQEQVKKLEIEVDNNEEYTVSEIVEKFKHFKNLLLNLAKTSEVPLNIEGYLFNSNINKLYK